MKKITLLTLLFVGLIGTSSFARTIGNFNFSGVLYQWGSAYTANISKDNTSNAVYNLLSSAGGYVEGNRNTDVKLWYGVGGEALCVVGEKWNTPANTRSSIPYFVSEYGHTITDLTRGGYIFMEISMSRPDANNSRLRGSWSPDSW